MTNFYTVEGFEDNGWERKLERLVWWKHYNRTWKWKTYEIL